jgi:ATP-binding cassette, subfamily B, bacterial PglK
MKKALLEIYKLLNQKQKKEFFLLQILVTLSAICEIVGVASIAPFMALIGDPGIVEKNPLALTAYQLSKLNNQNEFIFWLGVCVLLIMALSSLLSMYVTWKLSMFSARIGSELADDIYEYYMKQSWLFHAFNNSSELTKKISIESERLSLNIISPIMQINSKIALVLLMSFGIFLYDPFIAITAIFIFALAYIIIYKMVRGRLHKNGDTISHATTQRFKLMNEGFGGIREIILSNKSNVFIEKFRKSSKELAFSRGNNNTLLQVPRHFVELIAFGSIIAFIIFLMKTNDGNLGYVLPIISVYALAGFKMLPAFQQIYSSFSQIKSNLAAFNALRLDIQKSRFEKDGIIKIPSNITDEIKLTLNESIELINISFKYPGKPTNLFENLKLKVKSFTTVGIVGGSGSGKSTLADIISGIVEHQNGLVKVDGVPITLKNKQEWQKKIGFVSQSIFLIDDTICQNIAFGLDKEDVDTERVMKSIELAHLDSLIDQLKDGIYTKIGEKGVQLSGGQRQRLGIARALYNNAEVLIFDEATSALDGRTEKMVMDSIRAFQGEKTIIIIAHRLETIKNCDVIHFVENGNITASGKHDDLISNNKDYRRIAVGL